jgi:hypothetical protein
MGNSNQTWTWTLYCNGEGYYVVLEKGGLRHEITACIGGWLLERGFYRTANWFIDKTLDGRAEVEHLEITKEQAQTLGWDL